MAITPRSTQTQIVRSIWKLYAATVEKIFKQSEFFKPALTDGFSLESEWQQVSSDEL